MEFEKPQRLERQLIVIPMAGLGSRFPNDVWNFKPLIMINGRSLLEYSLKSIPINKDDFVLFIVLDNSYFKKILFEIMNYELPCKWEIIRLSKQTRGQAETVFFGLLKLNKFQERPLLIHNCDTALIWPKIIKNDKSEGQIFLFLSDSEKYSYVEMDAENKIIKTAEKVVISNFATTGTYFFDSSNRFIQLYKEAYKTGHSLSQEQFIAPLYNFMIKKGEKVIGTVIESVFPFGTPEEIEQNSSKACELWTPAW